MDIICSICNDLLDSTTETYITPCGHIFHYICLIQWIRQSHTCPQCRQKATEKTIHKVYFNKANRPEANEKDTFTSLQCKYDTLQFQLRLKDLDLKNLKENFSNLESQNIGLKKEVKSLQSEISAATSYSLALKDQISYFKTKSKERDKLANEIQELKDKLKQVEHLEVLLRGSKDEIDDMLRNNNDPQSLQLMVSTLKKELINLDKKKKQIYSLLKETQQEASNYKKEIALLNRELLMQREETKNCEEIKVENQYLKQKIRNVAITSNDDEEMPNSSSSANSDESIRRIVLESPIPQKLTIKMFSEEPPIDSPSIEARVKTINNSDSPYLPVKSNSLGFANFIDLKRSKDTSQKNSIFPSHIHEGQVKKPQGSFDGMGGYIKEEIVPSFQKSENLNNCKKRTLSSKINSKKRKLAPIRKIDDFFKE